MDENELEIKLPVLVDVNPPQHSITTDLVIRENNRGLAAFRVELVFHPDASRAKRRLCKLQLGAERHAEKAQN